MADPTPHRPTVPSDYGIPAELPVPLAAFDVTRSKLASARNYWVSSSSRAHGAHAAPVWGVWVDDELWFSTDARSAKGRNLREDPRVSVHLESGDDVVVVRGRVERIPHEHPDARRFVTAYETKYEMTFPDPLPEAYAVWRVRPGHVLVWTEADFATSAVRWGFA